MRYRGRRAPKFELVARAYVLAFVVALAAALLSVGDSEPAAAAKRAAPRALTTSTTFQPVPVTAPAAAVLALGPDLEHHLPGPTAPDGRPAVVLTFDDGPQPFFTPRVLDVLKSRGIKAVFCMVGTEVEKYPYLVARIAAEGHALCNHSYNHDTHMSQRDPDYVAAMLRHPANLIRDITGRAPTLYRGPGGDLSVFIIEEAHRLGMRILGWSVDPADYFKPGASEIQERIVARVHPGAIVLMHDGGGERTQTVEQLAGLIDQLAAAGYSFVLP